MRTVEGAGASPEPDPWSMVAYVNWIAAEAPARAPSPTSGEHLGRCKALQAADLPRTLTPCTMKSRFGA